MRELIGWLTDRQTDMFYLDSYTIRLTWLTFREAGGGGVAVAYRLSQYVEAFVITGLELREMLLLNTFFSVSTKMVITMDVILI